MTRLRVSVAAAPDAVPFVLLALTLPVGVAVTLGWFTPWFVLPAAALAVLALWPLRLREPLPATWALPAGLAVVAALAWMLVHLRLTGEFIAVDRDPAVYALTGIWLVDHASVTVPMTEAADAAVGIDGARTSALGFGLSADPLSPEFAHTLPGVVAVAGWAGGTSAVLAANVVVGAIALLSLYAMARRVVGPWWALLAPVAMALAMPLVAFSRSTYSEPLSLALGAAGVTALTTVMTGDPARRGRYAVLAGLFLGAVGLVRIDGGLLLAGALAAVGLWVVVAQVERRAARAVLVRVAGAGSALVLLGLLDMGRSSGNYLSRLAGQAIAVVAAIVVALAVAAALVRWGAPVATWLEANRRRVALTSASVVGVFGIVLLTRPWWWQARFFAGRDTYVRDIERRQAEEGLALDGTRSYDELSLEWVSWYHGWPAVLVGVAGLCLLTWVALGRPDVPALAVLVTLGAPALLFLVRPDITPDHVWAMRRLVPAAVPLLLVAAAALLQWVAQRTPVLAVAAGAGAAVLALWPLLTWNGLFDVRDRVGQVAEAQAVCGQISDGRVVLANGVPGVDYLATVRIMCDAQVVTLTPTTQQGLAELRAAWGDRPLSLVTYDRDAMPWTTPPAEPVHEARPAMWERSLIGAPSAPEVWVRTMWSGTVLPDGRVEPTAP